MTKLYYLIDVGLCSQREVSNLESTLRHVALSVAKNDMNGFSPAKESFQSSGGLVR